MLAAISVLTQNVAAQRLTDNAAWMRIPKSMTAEMPQASGEARAARDRYFDDLIGSKEPLTAASAAGHARSEGSFSGPRPEILPIENRVIVLGTFNDFRGVFSASQKSIYTEVYVKVSDVFEDGGSGIAPGSEIVIGLWGGTATSSKGEVIRYLINPRPYFLVPGRTYWLILVYHSPGRFFLHVKDWDITDGIVRANTGEELQRERSKEGSVYLGLTVPELIRRLTLQFPR